MNRMLKITLTAVVLLAVFCAAQASAGEMEAVVNKLVEKGVLTPYEAQILVADAKAETAQDLAEGKASTAPEWTQKIKVKGDVRFRTQTDWGKGLGPAHQRVIQRVRARLGIEGKVNDQVKAGVYAVTGGNDPRSTNQTLDDNFETQNFNLDGYYITWTPQIPEKMGSAQIDLGKFKNPFNVTELLWDGDIWPAGMNVHYDSPNFRTIMGPSNIYANTAMLWLDEFGTSQRDPLLWVIQGGMVTDVLPEWGGVLESSLAYYGFGNTKSNQDFTNPVGNAGTNTRWGGRLGNSYRYDFHLVDWIVSYDAMRLLDWEFGHGLYADFIWNAGAAGTGQDFAWMLGAYVGTKKPKNPGEWKVWGNFRSIGRDAVPDYMPDSDFFGFTMTGAPEGGGTSSQGVNVGVELAVFKNTVLGGEYYYMWPMDINRSDPANYKEPYQLLQLDVNVKF